MYLIISSEILGPPSRQGPPHCGGCGGGSYATVLCVLIIAL